MEAAGKEGKKMDLEFPLSSALSTDRCLTTGAHRGEGVLTGGFFPVLRWQPFHQGYPTVNHTLPLEEVSLPSTPLIDQWLFHESFKDNSVNSNADDGNLSCDTSEKHFKVF